MKNIWYVVNIGLVALSLRGGYESVAPERLRHINPDPISCGLILLFTPLFALWIVNYSIRRWKHGQLARPSLGRNPLNWWHDPLQSLFITMCSASAAAIGSALRHPIIGSVGFWMVAVNSCFALGFLIGQALVYRVFRENILAA